LKSKWKLVLKMKTSKKNYRKPIIAHLPNPKTQIKHSVSSDGPCRTSKSERVMDIIMRDTLILLDSYSIDITDRSTC